MSNHSSRSTLAIALAAAALGAAAPALADTNLVTNGSLDFAGNNQLAGWAFLVPGGEYWNTFGSQPSPDGGTYLGIQDLDDFAPRFNAGGITQTVGGLQVGANYTLTFYSMTNHDAVDPNARQDWIVDFGGATQTSAQTFYVGDGVWTQSTMHFTATSASQVLSFTAQYLPGSYPEMLNLDGISLTQAPAVPEPTSWALLLGGLGAVGWAARRHRARSA